MTITHKMGMAVTPLAQLKQVGLVPVETLPLQVPDLISEEMGFYFSLEWITHTVMMAMLVIMMVADQIVQ